MGEKERNHACWRILKRRVPILGWLPSYNGETALADLIAGLTVGLTVMPQGLAYASLAGLDTQYGLYSAFMGCFVYTVLGGCKDITIGPTALMSLMTYQQVFQRNPDYAVLLCFLTGCVQLLMAPLRLGVLVEFISQPVTVGFTTATSVIIIGSQLKGLLGLSFTSEGFLDTLKMVALHIRQARLYDTTMGLVCIIVLLLMRKMKDLAVAGSLKPTRFMRVCDKLLWLLSLSRNALIVIVCSTLAYAMQYDYVGEPNAEGVTPFRLTGKVRPGLPPIRLPPFSTELGNRTVGFTEMISDLGSSIILVPVIAVLGNVAIAKAFTSGDSLDATQELLTLGTCNLLGSFVSSMPVTGSFSRSAVNHASGVKTPMGGVYTGILILLALSQLTPYFFYIPKASLAAVIICAVIFMIEYEVIRPMWKASKKDLLPMVATFLVCLLYSVEVGIIVGVAVNIAILMFFSARPNMNIEKMETSNGIEYMKITPTSNVYFPGVEHLRSVLLSSKHGQLPIVIDCSLMMSTDFTTAKMISSLLADFHSTKRPILFYNIQPSLLAALKPVCIKNFVHVATEDQLNECLLDNYKNGSVVTNGPRSEDIGTELIEMNQEKKYWQNLPWSTLQSAAPAAQPLISPDRAAPTFVAVKQQQEA